MDILYYLGVVGGCAGLTIVALVFGWYAFEYVRERLENIRYDKIRGIFLSDISQIERWCGYESPQISLLCQRLREQWLMGASLDAQSFREKLRVLIQQSTEGGADE